MESKAELEKQAINFFIKDVEGEINRLIKLCNNQLIKREITESDAREKFNNERVILYSKLVDFDLNKKIEDLISSANKQISINSKELTKDNILKWFMTEYDPHAPLDFKIYRKNEDIFDSKYIGFIGIEGYNVHTNQAAIRIRADRNKPLGLLISFIREALVYIKPILESDRPKDLITGYKRMGIFEYTLSRYASYSLLANDKHCRILRQCYGTQTIVLEGTVEECVKYIYDKLPYKFRDDEVEPNDDD